MQPIEFMATVENGMIAIPPQYLKQIQPRLKVILLQETPMASQSKPRMKRDAILASIKKHRFDLPSDYHFNRDELYDR